MYIKVIDLISEHFTECAESVWGKLGGVVWMEMLVPGNPKNWMRQSLQPTHAFRARYCNSGVARAIRVALIVSSNE